nr:MAG TPA: hypothetical protein [Caudoviricetes sp.]
MATTENDRKRQKTTAVFVAALLLAVALGFLGGRRSATQSLLERVDTLVIRDTLVDYRPAVTEVRTVRVDTVRLAVAQPPDTVVVHDTVEVEVPIVFSRYRGDNYDIGVSGFRTELEYVKVYPQTKIVTKGYSIEPKRWGFGVAVGPSVLVAPSGRVNAGLGVTGGFYLRL